MNSFLRSGLVFTFLVTGLAATGCSRRAPVVTAEAPPTAPAPAPAPVGDASAREAAERARLEAEAQRREALGRATTALMAPIYFDYDSYSIRSDSRPILDAKVPYLAQYPGSRLMIEGHTDERGSTEYNLALGMRRAQAVRDYLRNVGVSTDRLDVTSYGKERPVDLGGTESAFARNRRAEFQLSGELGGSD